jgi:hypothetical protein
LFDTLLYRCFFRFPRERDFGEEFEFGLGVVLDAFAERAMVRRVR